MKRKFETLKELNGQKNAGELYYHVNEERRGFQPKNEMFMNKEGKLLCNKTSKGKLKKYFKELLHVDHVGEELTGVEEVNASDIEAITPLLEKVECAISRQKQ